MKFKQKLFNIIRLIISKFYLKFINIISYSNFKLYKKKHILEYIYHYKDKKISIFSNYRYKVKPGWAFFKSLQSLSLLKNQNLLNKSEVDFFNSAIGQRTLMKPLEEINIFSQKICQRFKDFYYIESLENEPTIRNYHTRNHEILEIFKVNNLKRMNFLNSKIKKKLDVNSNILEIGFVSGGHSIIAFEKLGFNSFGIDNFYDGNFENSLLPYLDVKNQLKSKSTFIKGDISKRNVGLEKNFDLIYSTSVLEHLMDIDGSFLEMNHLLKENGLIFHNYQPYFCVDGGHALGIGDSPFMHLQLNHAEYVEYLKKNRPFENEMAISWISENMNRKISQNIMKEKIKNAGFEIIYFNSFNYHKHNADLTDKVQKNIFKNYDFLSKEDLLGSSVTVIAKKVNSSKL